MATTRADWAATQCWTRSHPCASQTRSSGHSPAGSIPASAVTTSADGCAPARCCTIPVLEHMFESYENLNASNTFSTGPLSDTFTDQGQRGKDVVVPATPGGDVRGPNIADVVRTLG